VTFTAASLAWDTSGSRIQVLQALLVGGHREAPMIWTAGSVVRTGWERVGGPKCVRLGRGAT
jgi:hypothetical protein